jgi:two-component system, NtrC family, response regulator PilR
MFCADASVTNTATGAAELEESLVGQSPAIAKLKDVAGRAAKRPSTIMILGETGSGKEMLARYIHRLSPRADRPFVPVDCSALAESLFESQLFGHVRGAFTGAMRDTVGFVRAANGGTLFLDEIGELSPHLQAKLLRVLQERRVTPLGDTRAVPVDVRVISATHRDLWTMVGNGGFRQDLLFRLQVITLSLPPLRDRREDIPPLGAHFLARLAQVSGEGAKALSLDAEAQLLRYPWPGNVRELFNVLEHATVLSETGMIELSDLPPPLNAQQISARSQSDLNLEAVERRTVMEALRRCRHRRTPAAMLLGIDRRRLNRLIVKLKIELPRATKMDIDQPEWSTHA